MTEIERIAILDTNALHGDVFAERQHLSTMFEAIDSGLLEGTHVWTPRGVVEELVRQFEGRLTRMRKVLGAIEYDLSSFGLKKPDIPKASEQGATAYRDQLETRLTSPTRSIAPNPTMGAVVIEWAARRRHPIKEAEKPQLKKDEKDYSAFDKLPSLPLRGVVDAGIWLTMIDALQGAQLVTLITNNVSDFADPKDKSKPHPLLVRDIEEAGLNAARVEIVPTPAEFNAKYVAALDAARSQAETFLGDEAKKETLRTEIADAIEWYPVRDDHRWDFGVEIDEITLAQFEPSTIELVRADPAPEGAVFMTLKVGGTGRFDIGMHKGEAYHIHEDGPLTVYDFDWNESMAAAEAEIEIVIDVEARVSKDGDDVAVALDDINPA